MPHPLWFFKGAGFDFCSFPILFLCLHNLTSPLRNSKAVQPPQIAVQPLISTIPCKLLNILANLMIKSFMLPSQPNHTSNRPRRLFAHRRSPLALAPVTPFVATLAAASQLAENSATLSPFAATLTRRVKPNPFVCHSYKKHPGVGVPRHIFPLSCSSILSVISALSALKSPCKSTSLPPLEQEPSPRALFSLLSRNRAKLNPSFSHSSALFCTMQSSKPFPLNNLRTLCTNTRGWGTPRPYTVVRGALVTSFQRRLFSACPQRTLRLCVIFSLHGSRDTGHGTHASRSRGTKSPLPRLHRCGGKFYA